MKKTIGLAVAALCVFAATPAPGEDAAPRVTLAEALRVARAQNPDLLAARADVESARAQRATAVALPNPALAYSTSKIATDGSPANTIYGNGFYSRSYDTVVSASQLVEIGGKRKDRRVSADEGIARTTAASSSRAVSARRPWCGRTRPLAWRARARPLHARRLPRSERPRDSRKSARLRERSPSRRRRKSK